MMGGTKSSGAQWAYRPQCVRAAKPWLRPHKEEEEEEEEEHDINCCAPT
jgi:hypothetical protein